MIEPRLEHQAVKIRQLVEDYRLGRTVISEFQREYVWKPNKASRLIDSLIITLCRIGGFEQNRLTPHGNGYAKWL